MPGLLHVHVPYSWQLAAISAYVVLRCCPGAGRRDAGCWAEALQQAADEARHPGRKALPQANRRLVGRCVPGLRWLSGQWLCSPGRLTALPLCPQGQWSVIVIIGLHSWLGRRAPTAQRVQPEDLVLSGICAAHTGVMIATQSLASYITGDRTSSPVYVCTLRRHPVAFDHKQTSGKADCRHARELHLDRQFALRSQAISGCSSFAGAAPLTRGFDRTLLPQRAGPSS